VPLSLLLHFAAQYKFFVIIINKEREREREIV